MTRSSEEEEEEEAKHDPLTCVASPQVKSAEFLQRPRILLTCFRARISVAAAAELLMVHALMSAHDGQTAKPPSKLRAGAGGVCGMMRGKKPCSPFSILPERKG